MKRPAMRVVLRSQRRRTSEPRIPEPPLIGAVRCVTCGKKIVIGTDGYKVVSVSGNRGRVVEAGRALYFCCYPHVEAHFCGNGDR